MDPETTESDLINSTTQVAGKIVAFVAIVTTGVLAVGAVRRFRENRKPTTATPEEG